MPPSADVRFSPSEACVWVYRKRLECVGNRRVYDVGNFPGSGFEGGISAAFFGTVAQRPRGSVWWSYCLRQGKVHLLTLIAARPSEMPDLPAQPGSHTPRWNSRSRLR